jgi:hypothetical protein
MTISDDGRSGREAAGFRDLPRPRSALADLGLA